MSKQIQHGNYAKIDPQKDIVPLYVTNTIVPKKEQHTNQVPQPTQENILEAKLEVDENHK